MSRPSTKADILSALESNAESLRTLFSGRLDEAIFTGDPEHWGPAHHLLHLTMTSRAIARGLRSSRLPPHSTGRSRGYAELIAAASGSVGVAPKQVLLERGRIVVVPPGATRDGLMDDYLRAGGELRGAAEAWPEEELDRRAMTHPFLGEVTVREMLLFCVFHERHHERLVRTRW